MQVQGKQQKTGRCLPETCERCMARQTYRGRAQPASKNGEGQRTRGCAVQCACVYRISHCSCKWITVASTSNSEPMPMAHNKHRAEHICQRECAEQMLIIQPEYRGWEHFSTGVSMTYLYISKVNSPDILKVWWFNARKCKLAYKFWCVRHIKIHLDCGNPDSISLLHSFEASQKILVGTNVFLMTLTSSLIWVSESCH